MYSRTFIGRVRSWAGEMWEETSLYMREGLVDHMSELQLEETTEAEAEAATSGYTINRYTTLNAMRARLVEVSTIQDELLVSLWRLNFNMGARGYTVRRT